MLHYAFQSFTQSTPNIQDAPLNNFDQLRQLINKMEAGTFLVVSEIGKDWYTQCSTDDTEHFTIECAIPDDEGIQLYSLYKKELHKKKLKDFGSPDFNNSEVFEIMANFCKDQKLPDYESVVSEW